MSFLKITSDFFEENGGKGFWGPVTSSVDWCETNYQYSHYIAELFNTVSNLFYIILSVVALMHVRSFYNQYFSDKYKSYYRAQMRPIPGDQQEKKYSNEGLNGRLIRYYTMCVSVIFVGIGSWMFHMTLQVRDQMLDEISMHLPILCLLYCLLNFRDYVTEEEQQQQQQQKQQQHSTSSSSGSVLFGLFLSWKHFISFLFGILIFSFLLKVYNVHNPILFIITFFFEMIFSFAYSVKYARESGNDGPVAQMHKRNKIFLTKIIFSSFIFAFTVWNVDKVGCGTVIDYLKLHSGWHLFTALGSYYWSVFIVYAYYADKYDRLVAQGHIPSNGKGYGIEWRYFVFPWIVFNHQPNEKEQ